MNNCLPYGTIPASAGIVAFERKPLAGLSFFLFANYATGGVCGAGAAGACSCGFFAIIVCEGVMSR